MSNFINKELKFKMNAMLNNLGPEMDIKPGWFDDDIEPFQDKSNSTTEIPLKKKFGDV